MWRSHTSLGESRHHWQRQHHLPKANIIEKRRLRKQSSFFLAGAGGLGLVATTQSRVFDFGFATLLGIAQPQKLALLIFGNPARGSDSPPDCHSLPLPFEPSPNCIPAKRKSPRKKRGLFFLAGAGGLEPATHGFGVATKCHKALKILAFSHVSTHFSSKTTCRNCV